MPMDLKEEVLDTCLLAAEKFSKDYEKCTQESPPSRQTSVFLSAIHMFEPEAQDVNWPCSKL